MGKTIAEKILSEKVGREVHPGEIIQVEYDLIGSPDPSTGTASQMFDDWEGGIKNPDRVAIIPDHYVPGYDQESQRLYTICKDFAEENDIDKFYTQRDTGLMHAVVPEEGLVKPGDIFIGSDSHSTTPGAMGVFSTGISYTDLVFAWINGWTWLRVPESILFKYNGSPSNWITGKDIILKTLDKVGMDGGVYKSLEFEGSLISDLPMAERFSISNMAIEVGGESGFVAPDDITKRYVDKRVNDEYSLFSRDKNATYSKKYEFDLSGLEPQIAAPPSPDNVHPLSKFEEMKIDQAVIGTCTNCRRADLKQTANVLKGNRIDANVRMFITPGTKQIQETAYDEGWMEIFQKAGATVNRPGCGACFGERVGVLDENEVAISTQNRNFIGRMGPDSSEVYLSNPAVAAASAIAGKITHPKEIGGN